MISQLGLSNETILSVLKNKVPDHSYEGYVEFIHTHLTPNIAEVIAANNEVILFALDKGSEYDLKY